MPGTFSFCESAVNPFSSYGGAQQQVYVQRSPMQQTAPPIQHVQTQAASQVHGQPNAPAPQKPIVHHASSQVKMYSGGGVTEDSQLRRLRFDQQHPPVVPEKNLKDQSKFDAALAAMKRDGPVAAIPGGQHAAVGILMGKIVIRGPKSALDVLKKNKTLANMKDNLT